MRWTSNRMWRTTNEKGNTKYAVPFFFYIWVCNQLLGRSISIISLINPQAQPPSPDPLFRVIVTSIHIYPVLTMTNIMFANYWLCLREKDSHFLPTVDTGPCLSIETFRSWQWSSLIDVQCYRWPRSLLRIYNRICESQKNNFDKRGKRKKGEK